MVVVRVKIHKTIPTGNYANHQPEIEIEQECNPGQEEATIARLRQLINQQLDDETAKFATQQLIPKVE